MTMNDISTGRDVFLATILRQVKINVSQYQLEMLLDALKYMILTCNVGVLEEKVLAFNAYKLMRRLQSKLFSMPKKQYAVTLNISECYSVKRAYILYPSDIYILASIYMDIDSRIH